MAEQSGLGSDDCTRICGKLYFKDLGV